MNNQDLIKAERLFDAIGMIDEKIIAEAQAPFIRKKRISRSFMGAIAFACTFVICVSLGVGNLLLKDADKDSTDMQNSPVTDGSASTAGTLASLLDNLNGDIYTEKEIDLFDGSTSIIWRTSKESDEYRVLKLSSSENEIRRTLLGTGKQLSAYEADAVDCEVWISYGNGEVVSPYLQNTAGNVGYGELFEYSPEYEPNKEFVTFISNLIS